VGELEVSVFVGSSCGGELLLGYIAFTDVQYQQEDQQFEIENQNTAKIATHNLNTSLI